MTARYPLVINGTQVQELQSGDTLNGVAASGANSDITSLSGLTTALSIAQGGTNSTTAADARTALGLAIGTDVQAYDADLTSWSGKTAPTGDAVGTTDTQTLTNKTIEAGTFTNGYTEESVTANTGSAYTVDLANGSTFYLTLTANCTFTFPTVAAGKAFTLWLIQDGTGSRTVTWPATVAHPASTAPTLTTTASKADKLVFQAAGTKWALSVAGQNYTL